MPYFRLALTQLGGLPYFQSVIQLGKSRMTGTTPQSEAQKLADVMTEIIQAIPSRE